MAFEEVAHIALTGTDNDYLRTHTPQIDSQYMYIATGNIVRIKLSDFTQTSEVDPTWGTYAMGIDRTNGFLYYLHFKTGDAGIARRLSKIDLSTFTITATSSSAMTYTFASYDLLIDPVNNKGYATRYHSSAEKIAKFNLTNLTLESTLDVTETDLVNGVIDLSGGYMYWVEEFGTSGTPKLIQVSLSTFTKTNTLTLTTKTGTTVYANMNADWSAGYIYVTRYTTDAMAFIEKVSVSSFSVVDTYEKTTLLGGAKTAGTFYSNNNLYWISGNPQKIYSVNTNDMSDRSNIDISSGYGGHDRWNVVDLTNTYAYVAFVNGVVTIVKIGISTSLPISSIYHKWHEPVVIL